MHFLVALALVVVALVLSGTMRTIESALLSISRARVEEMVKDEMAGAAKLLKIVDNLPTHINILVLLQTLLDMTAAVIAASVALDWFESNALGIVVAIAVVSLVSYVVVGVYARTVGRKNPYTVALKTGWLNSILGFFLGWLARLLIKMGNILAPGEGFRQGPYTTEVDLREMVDIAQEKGIVELDERKMIQSVFDLSQTTARSVMVPRTEMVWVEEEQPASDALALFVQSGHSRMPVVGETVDDIVGVIYLKDVVADRFSVEHQPQPDTDAPTRRVADLMRDPTFVPDSKNLDDLLHEMQLQRNHIAMLVDEYGGIAGLISIEDILEEIVGEIADEYDETEVAPTEKIDDRRFRVQARLSLNDLQELVEEETGEEIEFTEDIEDTVDTVGGLIAYELGRVPLPGSTVETSGLTLTAEGTRDRRGRMRISSAVVTVL